MIYHFLQFLLGFGDPLPVVAVHHEDQALCVLQKNCIRIKSRKKVKIGMKKKLEDSLGSRCPHGAEFRPMQ